MHLWSQSSGAQGRDRWELKEGIGGRKRKKKEEGVIGEGPARALRRTTATGTVEAGRQGRRVGGQQGSRDGGGREARTARQEAGAEGESEDGGGEARTAAGGRGQRRGDNGRTPAGTVEQWKRHRARDGGGAPWRGTRQGGGRGKEAVDAGGDGRIAISVSERRWGRKANRDEGFGWFKVAWKS
ncbi:hypothetical protein Scep_024011 [Stephania cephalantha]|uniref:Uncharacterized protein n=1 Tax=Stephania cephalantha TaxID=152367 RepID=A0AAP0EVR4_9MAGN